MGGPSDSGSDEKPRDDCKLTPLDFGAPPTLSQRFRLKMNWDTPHLEWKPVKGRDAASTAVPPPPAPANPEQAKQRIERYINRGGYLFDLDRADWGPVDRAFQFAPVDPPKYAPTLLQIAAWRDESFYRRLGYASPSPLFGPSLSMFPLAPQQAYAPAPSLFYKPPDAPTLYGETPLTRPGKVGDALKAGWNMPITQRIRTYVSDELSRQARDFVRNDWDKWSGWRTGAAIAFSGVFVAGVVGALASGDDARHLAAENLLGVDVPVYLLDHHFSVFRVPGTTVKLEGAGAASNYLLGPAADPTKPREFKITVMVDLREAFDVIATYF